MPRSEAERILDRLEWTVLRRLDGMFQGDYRNLFRGAGLDLADLREYQPSDDVRYIDWNVTARLQTPYVRQYHEDRELTAWFVIDLSQSIEVSWSAPRKRAIAIEFVTLLSRMLTRRGNRVAAFIFDGNNTRVVPAGGSRDHVLYLLTLMRRGLGGGAGDGHSPSAAPGQTDLASVFGEVARLVRRRSLLFVVSDFVSEVDWTRSLGDLCVRHEALAIRVIDPAERELPDLGIMRIEDAESGEQVTVDTHSRAIRGEFARAVAEDEARVRGALAEAGVDALELVTTDDLIESILRFAELRRARQLAG